MIHLRLGSGIRTIGPLVVPTTTDVAVPVFESGFLVELPEEEDEEGGLGEPESRDSGLGPPPPNPN